MKSWPGISVCSTSRAQLREGGGTRCPGVGDLREVYGASRQRMPPMHTVPAVRWPLEVFAHSALAGERLVAEGGPACPVVS